MTVNLRYETWKLWLFCFFNIPLIFWLRPRVVALSNTEAEVVIKLNRRSRNHINSMYFGALCVGVDLVPGVLTMRLIKQKNEKMNFLFKDFQGEFLHRCEGDVHFICKEGDVIAAAIDTAIQTQERVNVSLNVIATVPTKLGHEPAGKFKLTISIKKSKA